MREQNTKTTVPLDVAPERRTKRCSPRFRPGGRFCELSFRYQSSPTGREGEISRPLDHMRHIPLIHSARIIDSINFYIYRTVLPLFPPCGTFKCYMLQSVWHLHMRSCRNSLFKVQSHHWSHSGVKGRVHTKRWLWSYSNQFYSAMFLFILAKIHIYCAG